MPLQSPIIDTPKSESSTYFDAPNNMSAEPTSNTDSNLARNPSVKIASHIGSEKEASNDSTNTYVHEQSDAREAEDVVTKHPNGSSGWLPTAEPTEINANDTPNRTGSILKNPSPPMNARETSPTISDDANTSNRHSPRDTSMTSLSGKRSVFTTRDGGAVDGGTFINGAGTTGPNANPDFSEAMAQRSATADESLTAKQSSKIQKVEAKEGKRLSKIIRQEAKTEKQAVTVAIKELAELQKIQKTAVKREAKAHTAHTKALSVFQKHEAVFLAARSKYEAAQSTLSSETETLELNRSNAREATEKMQDKSVEVESLRTMLGVDERERAVKLGELDAAGGGGFSCFS